MCILLIHRAFHNDECAQRMLGEHSPEHTASSFNLDRSGNDCRVIYFRGFAPYTPTSFCLMEHKSRFIGEPLPPLNWRPVAVLASKFQPSLSMNSSQHRRSLSKKNPVASAGVERIGLQNKGCVMDKCVQMLDKNNGALGYQAARECICVLRTNRTSEAEGDFWGLPMRRDERRVVDPPLVFKRVF
ncbi:hypothetical protein TNCV_134711 [Trichonephila clavipes]|nr:hypothetical protein TNCV_134711 [Trichonephila clavipes]